MSDKFSGDVAMIAGSVIAIIAKIAAPPETSIPVLMPASLPISSRSNPMSPPKASAMANRKIICEKSSIALYPVEEFRIVHQYS
jgi:hypothetical protein